MSQKFCNICIYVSLHPTYHVTKAVLAMDDIFYGW